MNQSSADDDSDAERTRDLHERDEFATRLKKKDSEKTRKVMSKSEQKVCCPCGCSSCSSSYNCCCYGAVQS